MAIRNAPFPAGDSKNATTKDRPALLAWRQFIEANWLGKPEMPGARISRTVGRNTGAGHGYFSKHAEGVALDLSVQQDTPRKWSMELRNALVNASDELGLVEVIHNEYKWNCNKASWQRYHGYDHKNHVHLGMDIKIAEMDQAKYLAIINSVMKNPNISNPFPDSPTPDDVPFTDPKSHLIGGTEQGAGKVNNTGSASADSGAAGTGTASDSGSDLAAVAKNYGPVGEENLVGMEQYKAYKTNIEGFDPGSVETDYDKDFTQQEKYTVANIKENLQSDKTTPQEYASRGVTFFGLVGILYSILMVGAHIFDRTNVFFEFNALKALTAGRMESVHDEEDATKGRRNGGGPVRTTFRGTVKYACIALVFSLILISGAVFGWLEMLIVFVQAHLPGQ